MNNTRNVQQPDIVRMLDAIEQEGFLNLTFIASGHEMVADILSGMPQVKVLLDQKVSSLPLMRARYQEQNLGMSYSVRLVYFVIFGLARDRKMICDIIAYLESCRDMPISTLLSPWHPFLHGMQALSKITGGQVQAPISSDSMKQLNEFLTKVTKWAELHND